MRTKEQRLSIYVEHNSVCPRRELDASRLVRYFEVNGCTLVDTPKNANFNILVTCGFKDIAVNEALERIDELVEFPGETLVIGCLPGTAPKRLSIRFNGKKIVTSKINDINNYFPKFKIPFELIPCSNICPDLNVNRNPLSRSGFPETSLKNPMAIIAAVQGCANNCSYCGIRFATGKIKSKVISQVLEEYKSILRKGYEKIIFEGDDTGGYGIDIGKSISDLLDAMYLFDKGRKDIKWQINSIHPAKLIKFEENILKYIEKGRVVALNCDVQSGSQRILDLMNRFYDIKKLVKIFQAIKEINSKTIVISSVIVGFPTETKADFESTLAVLGEVLIDEVYISIYSDMEGAKAAKMENKISKEIKENRQCMLKEFLEKNYNYYTAEATEQYLLLKRKT